MQHLYNRYKYYSEELKIVDMLKSYDKTKLTSEYVLDFICIIVGGNIKDRRDVNSIINYVKLTEKYVEDSIYNNLLEKIKILETNSVYIPEDVLYDFNRKY